MDRFWSKVNKDGDNGCWEWTGALNRHGYGSFWLDKCVLAHRIAWRLANGPIPEGKLVMHSCDNRICCNPEHLFTGTNQDNMDDMVEKGRANRMPGETHPMSKLTERAVLWIRMWAGCGYKQVDIASAFGIDQTNVSCITTRKTWRHI